MQTQILTHIADLPNIKQVLRRSGRLSKAKSVKRLTMGSEISNFQTPFTANIEISFGEEERVTVREVVRNVPVGRQVGETDRQEQAAQRAAVTRADQQAGVARAAQAGVTRETGGTAGGRSALEANGQGLATPGCSSDGSLGKK